jgi:hypothetical protein
LPALAFAYFDEEYRAKHNCDLEVAYWRKCWNVRSIIMDVLKVKDNNDSYTTMTIDDVDAVITALYKINKKNWLDRGSTIWDWKEFKGIQRRNIRNLRRLRYMMRKKPEVFEVYFYDSW